MLSSTSKDRQKVQFPETNRSDQKDQNLATSRCTVNLFSSVANNGLSTTLFSI